MPAIDTTNEVQGTPGEINIDGTTYEIKDLTAGGYISVDAKQIRIHKRLPAHW